MCINLIYNLQNSIALSSNDEIKTIPKIKIMIDETTTVAIHALKKINMITHNININMDGNPKNKCIKIIFILWVCYLVCFMEYSYSCS